MSIISTLIIDLETILVVLLTANIESPGTSTLFYGLTYCVSIICIMPIIFNIVFTLLVSLIFNISNNKKMNN